MNTDLQVHINGYADFGIILHNDTLEIFKKCTESFITVSSC